MTATVPSGHSTLASKPVYGAGPAAFSATGQYASRVGPGAPFTSVQFASTRSSSSPAAGHVEDENFIGMHPLVLPNPVPQSLRTDPQVSRNLVDRALRLDDLIGCFLAELRRVAGDPGQFPSRSLTSPSYWVTRPETSEHLASGSSVGRVTRDSLAGVVLLSGGPRLLISGRGVRGSGWPSVPNHRGQPHEAILAPPGSAGPYDWSVQPTNKIGPHEALDHHLAMKIVLGAIGLWRLTAVFWRRL